MTKAPFFAVACLLFADTGWAAECSRATVHGIYNYSYAGYTINGATVTRFAVAGLDPIQQRWHVIRRFNNRDRGSTARTFGEVYRHL